MMRKWSLYFFIKVFIEHRYLPSFILYKTPKIMFFSLFPPHLFSSFGDFVASLLLHNSQWWSQMSFSTIFWIEALDTPTIYHVEVFFLSSSQSLFSTTTISLGLFILFPPLPPSFFLISDHKVVNVHAFDPFFAINQPVHLPLS